MTPRGDGRSRLPVVRPFLPVLLLTGAVAACGSTRVPPPDGSSPETVARAYLDALVAGDCTATRALLAGGGDPALSDLCGIGRVDRYLGLVGPTGGANDAEFAASLVLRDMPPTSGWPDGEATVFLRLARATGDPWRVEGVSSGP